MEEKKYTNSDVMNIVNAAIIDAENRAYENGCGMESDELELVMLIRSGIEKRLGNSQLVSVEMNREDFNKLRKIQKIQHHSYPSILKRVIEQYCKTVKIGE